MLGYHSLFGQLLRWFLAMAAIVSGLFGFAHYRYLSQVIDTSSAEQLQASQQRVISFFDQFYSGPLGHDLHFLARSPSLARFISADRDEAILAKTEVERLFASFTRLQNRQGPYRQLVFLDVSGQEKIKVRDKRRLREYLSPEGLAKGNLLQQQTGQLCYLLGSTEIGHLQRTSMLTTEALPESDVFLVGVGVRDPDIGSFGGAIIAQLRLAPFLAYLNRVAQETGLHIALVNTASDTMLFQSRQASTPQTPWASWFNTREALTLTTEIYPNSNLAEQGDALLQLSFRQSPAQYDTQVIGSLQQTALLTMLVFSFSIALAYFVARRVVTPILDLCQVADAFGQGDWSRRAKLQSSNEIGHLAAAFNRMAKNLQETTVSRNFVDNILRSMSNGLLVATPEGQIATVNRATLALLGYDKDELLGQPLAFLCTVASPAQPSLTDWMQQGTAHPVEQCLRAKNGQQISVLLSCAVLKDSNNLPQGMVGLIIDLSEQKRAEVELIEARELAEQASRAKSEFLARMSHEFRTPMNAILGFGQLLAMEEEDAEKHEKLQEILISGQRLLGLIDEVLEFSRIENSRLQISLEDLEVTTILDHCRAALHATAQRKGIPILQDCNFLPVVRADRDRLEQVVMQLLSNAIKFSRKGGNIRVVAQLSGANKIAIRISDRGIGIRPQEQDKIFQPFTRGSHEGQAIDGAGIGLSLAKRLVELMGGKIGFESEFGQGSTFWVELPLGISARKSA